MLKKIGAFYNHFIAIGADGTTSKNELKKIKLLNFFCGVWFVVNFSNCIESYFLHKLKLIEVVLIFITISCFILSILLLHYKKKFLIARVFFTNYILAIVFYVSNYVVTSQLQEFFFLLAPITSLILIDNKKINFVVFIISSCLFFLPNFYYDHYEVFKFNNLSLLLVFTTVFIAVNYFKKLNVNNEKTLKIKTKELEKLDEFKSQFFTNISHEIRTPLTLINGQVSDLEQYIAAVPEIAASQKNIKKQIQTITNMVDNVLDLAKMKSSNFSLQLKPVNISELVRKQYVNFEPLFQQKKVAFTIPENITDYVAKVDLVFLERAINNMIINALKYTDFGRVSIAVFQKEEQLMITISDTGIGIAKNDFDIVFNRFHQVNNDINAAGGSGVGLAFSKEIVELHGGEILLESELNKGSEFTIVLPLEKSVPKKASIIDPSQIIQEKESTKKMPVEIPEYQFLIVEDNFDMRKYLISLLDGYTCLEAENGVEALEILEKETIDFVLTDYMMPKLNGYEFVKKMKAGGNATPVIMITAKTDTDVKLEVLKLGVDDYITKPFDKEELLVRIDNCIHNYKKRRVYNEKHKINLQDQQDHFISELKTFVFEKSNDPTFSQEIIADEFNISKSSVYRKIKSETGLSPNNFIKEIRLQKARGIIEHKPDILLKQLASEVGFNHHAYFTKIYSERFGVKPIKKISRFNM